MKDILRAPFIEALAETCSNMYRLGWDERNGGNISYLLDEEQVREYLDPVVVLRLIPLSFDAKELAGRIFLVTGTGKYFKNVPGDPEDTLGIVRIAESGMSAELLWGFRDGGRFTSEFPAHMMSHRARMTVDSENHVVMHCHPTDIIAMTHVHDLNEKEFTKTLWRMCIECMLAFPDGINVLPWMPCGTEKIGLATAEKMITAHMVVWAQHGVYATGRTLDEAFGLIETADKAAAIYLKIAHLHIMNRLSDEDLRQLAAQFKVQPRAGYLD